MSPEGIPKSFPSPEEEEKKDSDQESSEIAGEEKESIGKRAEEYKDREGIGIGVTNLDEKSPETAMKLRKMAEKMKKKQEEDGDDSDLKRAA